jgi:hypothetical protein
VAPPAPVLTRAAELLSGAERPLFVLGDRDPMALGRFHPVEVPVLGDVGVTAAVLAEAISGRARCIDHRPELAGRWSIWRAEKARRRADDRGHGLNSAAIFDVLGQVVEDDAVVCANVGNNAYAFGRYFEVSAQSVLMSGYLGSIGFALPATLGAWAAVRGECEVVSISGDGGFGQYAMELTTAVKYAMLIRHILLDNDELAQLQGATRRRVGRVADRTRQPRLRGVRAFLRRLRDPGRPPRRAGRCAHRGVRPRRSSSRTRPRRPVAALKPAVPIDPVPNDEASRRPGAAGTFGLHTSSPSSGAVASGRPLVVDEPSRPGRAARAPRPGERCGAVRREHHGSRGRGRGRP